MVAPGRAKRPGAALEARADEPADDAPCPFCEGHEAETPPETLALGRPEGSAPDSPGWQLRVVPNLYPALERQEVVIHVPQHARSVAELSVEDLAIVAEAWSARAAAAQEEGFPYVQAFLNEGREAGASRAHTHSQLAWLREVPPAVRAESDDALPSFVRDELESGRRVIAERDGVVLLAAYAGRLPYELLIAPVEHVDASPFGSPLLATALELLGDAIRRLRALEGPVPLNAWLHAGRHWHIEVLPRLSVLASLELGAGIYINTLPPEEAAERLR